MRRSFTASGRLEPSAMTARESSSASPPVDDRSPRPGHRVALLVASVSIPRGRHRRRQRSSNRQRRPYGATHSEVLVRSFASRGFLISTQTCGNEPAPNSSHRPCFSNVLSWHGSSAWVTARLTRCRSWPTSRNLAVRHGHDGERVQPRDGVRGRDPAHKAASLCTPITTGPFYGMDISVQESWLTPPRDLLWAGCASMSERVWSEGRPRHGRRALRSRAYRSGHLLQLLRQRPRTGGLLFSGRRAGAHAATSLARVRPPLNRLVNRGPWETDVRSDCRSRRERAASVAGARPPCGSSGEQTRVETGSHGACVGTRLRARHPSRDRWKAGMTSGPLYRYFRTVRAGQGRRRGSHTDGVSTIVEATHRPGKAVERLVDLLEESVS